MSEARKVNRHDTKAGSCERSKVLSPAVCAVSETVDEKDNRTLPDVDVADSSATRAQPAWANRYAEGGGLRSCGVATRFLLVVDGSVARDQAAIRACCFCRDVDGRGDDQPDGSAPSGAPTLCPPPAVASEPPGVAGEPAAVASACSGRRSARATKTATSSTMRRS